jgi:hypothetical protein
VTIITTAYQTFYNNTSGRVTSYIKMGNISNIYGFIKIANLDEKGAKEENNPSLEM